MHIAAAFGLAAVVIAAGFRDSETSGNRVFAVAGVVLGTVLIVIASLC
jgi:hypothetical protein